MTNTTGREPSLPQPSDLTGREPALGGGRRENPMYWAGVGILRRVEFWFGMVREQTPLEIVRCLQRNEALLIINGEQDRSILLQPTLYLSDTLSNPVNDVLLHKCTFIGWASESYPDPAHAALRLLVGPDLTHYRIDITPHPRPAPLSYYFSDTV